MLTGLTAGCRDMSRATGVHLYTGDALAAYGFGEGHLFGPDRLGRFMERVRALGLDRRAVLCDPQSAEDEALLRFHTPAYLDRVKAQSLSGEGYLDCGDTPAFKGVYEAAATVVGTTLAAVDDLMAGRCRHAMVPIAGLHHAARNEAAGFCVFNDCGVAIETLRQCYGVQRVAYVDIDAHHGDGVFYAFDADPALTFVDLHEDGRYLYPGTGRAEETGVGKAAGTKLNIPMPPGADDAAFLERWTTAEAFIERSRPEFILFQCGADSLKGDPITHLEYTSATHGEAAARLKHLADALCEGRLLAMGGGGYNRTNLADAWSAVLSALLGESA